jgi:hypothetical protein
MAEFPGVLLAGGRGIGIMLHGRRERGRRLRTRIGGGQS